jgi:DNA polymerase-1
MKTPAAKPPTPPVAEGPKPLRIKERCLRTKLGIANGKFYYWAVYRNQESGELLRERLEWRVPDIREAIQAEAGMRILSADYSQVEIKIMAVLSGDPILIAAINSGQDIHSYNAVRVFGAKLGFDYELLEKARKDDKHPRHVELSLIRSGIKTTVFGTSYGAGPQKVADMTGMTLDEAKEFIDEFFRVYHVLKAWLDKLGDEAIRNTFSSSPRGRKRFYTLPHPADKEKEASLAQIRRWAGNMPIQASNVDMLKPAMRQIYRRFQEQGWTMEDARILFVVHDEIVVTCREDLVEECTRIMEEEMETSFQAIINGKVINRITVANDTTWKKA